MATSGVPSSARCVLDVALLESTLPDVIEREVAPPPLPDSEVARGTLGVCSAEVVPPPLPDSEVAHGTMGVCSAEVVTPPLPDSEVVPPFFPDSGGDIDPIAALLVLSGGVFFSGSGDGEAPLFLNDSAGGFGLGTGAAEAVPPLFLSGGGVGLGTAEAPLFLGGGGGFGLGTGAAEAAPPLSLSGGAVVTRVRTRPERRPPSITVVDSERSTARRLTRTDDVRRIPFRAHAVSSSLLSESYPGASNFGIKRKNAGNVAVIDAGNVVVRDDAEGYRTTTLMKWVRSTSPSSAIISSALNVAEVVDCFSLLQETEDGREAPVKLP
eukprot:CAMPEP_0194320568 /NCGR_PEP_ID=MMETSP0171-20130528/16858_1 /TAXON_ID=218684 /ORGANISM="Corethron pennatum, Strain L29A3" /LENGTH=323 /DNA_ID=CAMNT_0039078137 /DNA_START=1063 /DNA_END=2034 /DNA_ORIENTATION=+